MKLTRAINVLAVLLLIAAAATVYKIKYEATWQAVEVERLNRQIERERVSINILNAEWAHLTRPDRIQNLAEKHLDLKPADPHQRIALIDLPMRPPRVDSIADTIASLGGEMDMKIIEGPKPPGEDPIARTIESMGLAMPSADERIDRTMHQLGTGPMLDYGPPQ
jgi:cell division protein FtsL